MTYDNSSLAVELLDLENLSPQERLEMVALGILSNEGTFQPPVAPLHRGERRSVTKRAIHAPQVLSEAYEYRPRPSMFSRGTRVNLGSFSFLFISGTASVDEHGRTAHAGDFRAQCWRTYRNITRLLEAEGAGWKDVVRCTCYLRNIERDYRDFNAVRTAFFSWLELDPLPASVGIQAKLCWKDLLVEIETQAIVINPQPGETG